VTGLLGTIRYRIGRESLPVIATTPEASDLQAMLAYMVEKGAKYATMEVSSHALQLQRVVGCEFDIAVLTNITEDHLDFHKTFADYFSAKGKLFSQLGSFVKSGCRKYAVINRDDQNFSKIANLTTAQIITYGLHETADVRGEIISLNNSGAVFKVLSFAGETILRLKMSGLFSVYNALAAFTLGLLEGVSSMKIKEALEAIEGIPGRFEMIYAGQDFLVIVDYAHTPDGLENVLRTVNEFAQGEIITVFGCGGERDESKRPLMGKIAGKYSDYCFITNDNPRREDPERIVQQILSGIKTVMPPTKYKVVLDRYQAISEAITRANTNDVIVIAGKGHENIQVFYDRCIPFNDRRVAMEIIKKMLQIGV
jgi:UDP-N-acetylmuramoyl-L-alanyl-D-glutamate--2,6-diaminopimelate ligase